MRRIFPLLVLVVAMSAFAGIDNPDLKDVEASAPHRPAGWHDLGTGTVVAFDADIPFEGRPTVRVAKAQAQGFGGLGQTVAANAWHGKTIVVKAHVRVEGAPAESVRLFARGDAPDRAETTFLSNPIQARDRWTVGEVILDIPEDARGIALGVTINSTGRAWLARMEIGEVNPAADRPKEVLELIDEAIAKIRAHAYYAGGVDWQKARERALLRAVGPGETAPAMRYLLAQLKDNHSHYRPAAMVKEARGNESVDNLGVTSAQIGSAGYVLVPAFMWTNSTRAQAFAREIAERLAQLREAGVCGWIVDLRTNGGGNMYPMLAGLRPLLGDGPLGYHLSRERSVAWKAPEWKLPPLPKDFESQPVAVLVGPKTASSGEFVAMSFKGRDAARIFGTPTAGMGTANSGHELSDGSMVVLTSAVATDRTGVEPYRQVVPDERVEAGAITGGAAEDPHVQAALRWLRSICPP